jgi:hypothetical protein
MRKWGDTMHNKAHMIGMGCFAKSHTLQQRLRKVLENFTLTHYADIFPAAERMLNDGNLMQFFRSVIRLGTEGPDQVDRALELDSVAMKIIGFYIGMVAQSLHLMVFLKDRGGHQKKIIVRLERFNRLRKNRMN